MTALEENKDIEIAEITQSIGNRHSLPISDDNFCLLSPLCRPEGVVHLPVMESFGSFLPSVSLATYDFEPF